jgi:hypothetical protein
MGQQRNCNTALFIRLGIHALMFFPGGVRLFITIANLGLHKLRYIQRITPFIRNLNVMAGCKRSGGRKERVNCDK